MAIRFMGEHDVDVPLWDDDGLMFATREELLNTFGPLGLSPGLAKDVVACAQDWQTHSGEPEHDARAARLVRQLRGELGHGVAVVYYP